MATTTRVPLEVWQDPQGAVVAQWSDGQCRVYFRCWSDAGVRAPFVAEMTFHRPIGVRGESSEFPPYPSSGDVGPSFILEVVDSDWLAGVRARQKRAYGDRANALDPRFRHLVVTGHDNYVEVLCTGFDVRRIPPDEAPTGVI